jgi:elongation factor Ts
MAKVSMQQVKELRDRTQAGLNDCKNALGEADGDMEQAVELILKKGLAKSAKRAGAVASEGVVASRIAADGQSGVIVEVNIQTDFAAKNPDVLAFVDQAVEAAAQAKDGAELGSEPYPGGQGTLEENRQALVGRLGENITLRRWARVQLDEPGLVHSYIHMGGKIGALLGLAVADAKAKASDQVKKFADDSAMQIAAMAPLYLEASEVPASDKAKQGEIFDSQLADEGKPEAVRPKIVEGKINKWLKEVCLLEQPSVMESDKSVDQVRAAVAKALGSEIRLVKFVRFERGEGIEKKEDDFAAEAERMARG